LSAAEASPGPAPALDWEALRSRFAGLRVALVHDWLNGMRGGEKVLETLGRLFPEAPIHTLLAVPEALSAELRRHPIRTSFLQGYPFFERHYRHFLPLFPAAIEDFDFRGYDLIVSTSHCVAKGAIPAPHARHFCYCHSPMRYAWDQEHAYFPGRGGPIARLRSLLLSGLRQWDVASCPRVDHFWANSRFVARRLERYYGRSAEVVPPPIDLEAFRPTQTMLEKQGIESHNPSLSASPRFCLAVSALVPYKRLDLAILACQRLGFPLRIVGTGPEARRLARLCGPGTELLGRVSEEELRRLYREAASGTPVVAVGQGGILDIVEDGEHGVLYSGFEVDDLARAVDKAARIRFNNLKLIQRAEFFSTESFVHRIATSLDRRLGAAGPQASFGPGPF